MKALNEVASMVQKAALGAGIPLGQAEDLGRVATYLAGTGGDVAMIADVLDAPHIQPDISWGADEIRIAEGSVALTGPIVRDAFVMGIDRAVLADAKMARLVAAFLAVAGISAVVDQETIARADKEPGPEPIGPADVPQDIWNCWSTLAALTCVPESGMSRSAGAGAGLTDND